ncbi:hypothetical protein A3F62_02200 [Candidatus Woesebacteria bacterium RIFCSPHIGHO2_12_FULL_44_11]|uniref:Uncharacterized protein n=1 Tax=Candidatus Woesebacteria bacterium RIFCSPLOWO2_01_FULL_44_14 TaxID=1802525 RepID=A0A1F8C3K2_9BACT|nr:MAG: hypothetical protein A3F62_02200 [Candidatus Woesebacteria bacterium RIFCSPHIGHO2_12_FULL_44_11]OGM70872.1 MAG: hypothetical protein A2975_01190 [Candidatus Woesebacteria bacterium RIFCSPLOWO2_01_FULL_44_14]
MTSKQILEKIKSKGYWRILFEPLGDSTIKPLSRCRDLVVNNSVELRGWDYPHIPKRKGEDTALEPGDSFWQAWLDWTDYAHYEFWRFYQSGQFIHYLAIPQDWKEGVVYKNLWENDRSLESGEFLGVLGTVYLFTEIFLFASKLAAEGVYKDGLKITISLNNTENRKLFVDSHGRTPFFSEKKTAAEKIEYSEIYSNEDLIAKSKQFARDFILYFFERFDWQPNPEMIEGDQDKLLNRQI